MSTKELQDKIKILTGETIPEEKLGLLWALFLSEMQGVCNVDEFNREQIKELEGIFIMKIQSGDFSPKSKEVKSIKEGDVSVEYAIGSGVGSTTDSVKKRFIARNRRLKCSVCTEKP